MKMFILCIFKVHFINFCILIFQSNFFLADILAELTDNAKKINESLTTRQTTSSNEKDLNSTIELETKSNKIEEIKNIENSSQTTSELILKLYRNKIEIEANSSRPEDETISDAANSPARNNRKRQKICDANVDSFGSCRKFDKVDKEINSISSNCQYLNRGPVVIETKESLKENELVGMDNEDMKTLNATSILINGKRYYRKLFKTVSKKFFAYVSEIEDKKKAIRNFF